MSLEEHLILAVLTALENPRVAEAVAAQLEPFLRERLHETSSPWLDANEAAAYLRCRGRDGAVSVGRVRKLTSTGELPVHRDGSRVLYHRDELDQFIRRGGAISP